MLTKIKEILESFAGENFLPEEISLVFGDIDNFDVASKKSKVLFAHFIKLNFDSEKRSLYSFEIFLGEVTERTDDKKKLELWEHYEPIAKTLVTEFLNADKMFFVCDIKDFEIRPISYWGDGNYTGYVIDCVIKMYSPLC